MFYLFCLLKRTTHLLTLLAHCNTIALVAEFFVVYFSYSGNEIFKMTVSSKTEEAKSFINIRTILFVHQSNSSTTVKHNEPLLQEIAETLING